MCGIIGIIGKSNITDQLMGALKRLEYRGYDSAGIATLKNGHIECRRAQGKLTALEYELTQRPFYGTTGIGHTRWATHGCPSVQNAHPHRTEQVAVVHNGIIENFHALRHEMELQGALFSSETDSEVIPHLISYYLKCGFSVRVATMMALRRLEGSFAVVILFADKEQFLIASRRGSPLLIGYGDDEMFVGSDVLALQPLTSQVAYLEDGDLAEIYSNDVVIYNGFGERAERRINTIKHDNNNKVAEKGKYRHFMLKEIYEQPEIMAKTFATYYNSVTGKIEFLAKSLHFQAIKQITIIACGTSYYAGLVAKYWLEKLAFIPVNVDIASEFRYRTPVMPANGVVLCISQSGETADTLAALTLCRARGQHIISLVNQVESTMALASDTVLSMLAGPEIGVASTKAFTAALLMLACFTVALSEANNTITHAENSELCSALASLPEQLDLILTQSEALKILAKKLMKAQLVLYIGRGTSYPIALEGALKLKELTYIHAEAIAAGELKHGPIALIDEQTWVIVIAPSDSLFEKLASNVQEVAARGGKIVLFSDKKGIERLEEFVVHSILIPAAHSITAPLLYSIPVQLLAYHTAVLRGTDVDQPRNLAKSVTVE